MAKNIFDVIKRVEHTVNNNKLTNIVFIGANSKAELFYKNIPCEVVEKNYRYILCTKDSSQVQNTDDFYNLLENALMTQKILKESKQSKFVFVIDSEDIFNERAREFTNWLESIDKSFGSQRLFSSSCLVIESVSSDSDPILELQLLVKDSYNRISESNLQLLNEWLKDEKIELIPKFTRKNLGEYDGEPFKNDLNKTLQKCKPVSYFESKLFLPSDTSDFQRELYKDNYDLISDNLQKFISKFSEELRISLTQFAETEDLNNFKGKYNSLLTKLDVKDAQLYEILVSLHQINISNIPLLQDIIQEVELLKIKEEKLVELLPSISDLYDPSRHISELINYVDSLKYELKNDWETNIRQAEKAISIYLDLYNCFESNESYKLVAKDLGIKLHLKERNTTLDNEIDDLHKNYHEFNKKANELELIFQEHNNLLQSCTRTMQDYSKLTPVHKIIYQSIQTDIQEHKAAGYSFAHSYTQYIKNLYSELYSYHSDTIINLESKYMACIDTRENAIMASVGLASLGPAATLVTEAFAFGTIGTPIPVIASLFFSIWSIATAYAKKQKISENFKLFELGFQPVEEYYKLLPKDLREAWANINMFPIFSQYLKDKYPEDKIYQTGILIPQDRHSNNLDEEFTLLGEKKDFDSDSHNDV